MPYISACPIPARAMATGMSRRGLRISSPAVEGSSTPTKEYSRTGTTAMKVALVGVRSPTAMPWAPWRAPYRATLTVKKASRPICPTAPLVGSHLP